MIRKNPHHTDQLEFEFDRPAQEPKADLPVFGDGPDDWERGGNSFKKFHSTFMGKQLRTPEHEAHLKEQKKLRKEKKTGEVQGGTHDLIVDIMNPPSLAEQAKELMAEMRAVEELAKSQSLRTLHPRLSAIRTTLARLDVLHPQYSTSGPIKWDTMMFHPRSGTTVAESFLGTFHYYLDEILPMLAQGVVKTGEEAIAIHEHHIHEATDEVRRMLAERLEDKR